MNFITILVVACTIFSPSLSPAQDDQKLKFDDILMYFPLGKYETICHEETGLIRYNPLRELYYQNPGNFGNYLANMPLPTKMMVDLESFTIARKVKVRVYLMKPEDVSKRRVETGTSRRVLYLGGHSYAAENAGTELWVFRFVELDGLIKMAVKEGSLAVSKKKFYKKPVYTMNGRGRKGSQVDIYLYAMPEQALLACEDLELLKSMIDTGFGIGQNVIGEKSLEQLGSLTPDLGYVWTFSTSIYLANALEDKVEKDVVKPRKWEKNNLGYLKEMSQATISTYDFSSRLSHKTIHVFSTEKIARESAARWETSNEDNLVTSTRVFDEENLITLEGIKKERDKAEAAKDSEVK